VLKKDREIKWIVEVWASFSRIKKDFVEALILASLEFLRSFIIFYFASPNTMVVVLLQKNNEG